MRPGTVIPAHGAPGFTLLEMLVALVVLGLVTAGLSQGSRYGLRALAVQGRLIEDGSDLAAVDRTLRRLIERMEPGGNRHPARIEGVADRLGFTSVLPAAAGVLPAAGGTSARRATMALLLDGDRLVLRWTPSLDTQPFRPPAPAETELLRGVDWVEFAYGSEDGTWTSAWSGRTLPALVRIRIGFAKGDRRHWPDIVAAPLQERPGA